MRVLTTGLLTGLIEQFYREQRHNAFYAGRLAVSSQQLNTLLKGTTGKTLHGLVRERVLQEAKRLLQQDGVSVKHITYTLGFSDIAQFCKFFKKHTGMRPSAYAELARARAESFPE